MSDYDEFCSQKSCKLPETQSDYFCDTPISLPQSLPSISLQKHIAKIHLPPLTSLQSHPPSPTSKTKSLHPPPPLYPIFPLFPFLPYSHSQNLLKSFLFPAINRSSSGVSAYDLSFPPRIRRQRAERAEGTGTRCTRLRTRRKPLNWQSSTELIMQLRFVRCRWRTSSGGWKLELRGRKEAEGKQKIHRWNKRYTSGIWNGRLLD